MELESTDVIEERLENGEIDFYKNEDFTDK
jgi:hypothetical protein